MLVGMQSGVVLENRMAVPVKIELPHKPAILLLDVYPRKMKTCDHTKTGT